MGSTARVAQTMEQFQQAFTARIASLARTHSLLTDAKWQSVSFRELLRAELEPYDDGSAKRIILSGPPVELPSELAVPIGMAVHELTTNAAKHGSLAEFGGRVEVRWTVINESRRASCVGFGTNTTARRSNSRVARALAPGSSIGCSPSKQGRT